MAVLYSSYVIGVCECVAWVKLVVVCCSMFNIWCQSPSLASSLVYLYLTITTTTITTYPSFPFPLPILSHTHTHTHVV